MWRKGVKRINYTIYELHVKIRENLPKSIKNRQYKLNVWIKFIKFHSGNIMNETHFFFCNLNLLNHYNGLESMLNTFYRITSHKNCVS